ncbi:MAG TPA: bifunctional tRNA (5-methylaminomethyl-2-thiouridine)(34)-methyltransferase MnmD/FAD-dependent 5-carboxymethylaminomethyl-2-thiouridine(34) oxidoreductase MnmC [Rhodocyclaceae bacterium]|nr:bifunctional tRNA (5-methylaminomethyl-2-thiouridine)(34)-methyltransferase MnmD/FAD-dependent 5-carboxymethylaminomethyl-2-thiouridine(34) oxidoreductase MnmC [Rhodocyclaceae bacterium]
MKVSGVLQPASLTFANDGTPYSPEYDDIYHTVAGALAQAEHVFLRGNDLPQRWAGRESFVIIETGFGLGHNFLATWAAWRADPKRSRRLHFVSVEKHPFSAQDLLRAHANAGVSTELSSELVSRWPMLVPGFHRLELDSGRVALTLLFGEAETMLAECVAKADAIYLDGFAPNKNPDIWSPTVCKALAKLARKDCTLATWSVSGNVRSTLEAEGFAVDKAPGFANKRETLRGRFTREHGHKSIVSTSAATHVKQHAIVIGAGLAGTAIAERLAARDWQVTLLEAQAEPARGASGNLAGVFRPQPSTDDNFMARITRAGFVYALQHLARLAESGYAVRWQECGALHIARGERQAAKQQEAVAVLAPPAEYMQFVDGEEASRIAQQPDLRGGWWFPRGGWIAPPSLCNSNIAACGTHIDLRTSTSIERVAYDDGEWTAFDAKNTAIASAPILILANAYDARKLANSIWLPLSAARGQVSHLPANDIAPLTTVVCGSGYVTPAIDGIASMGATFVVDDLETDLRTTEHSENLDKLEDMLSGYGNNLQPDNLDGRASIRAITSDRLPVLGAMPDQPGLWVLSGFGARGLVWGNLCAELLASQICDEPLPLERSLIKAMSPTRFANPL